MTPALLLAAVTVGAPPAPDYLRDIKPLLQQKCVACHGAVRQKAGLRLDAAPLILKGTKRGPVVVPGKPDESLLIEVVADEPARMPPKAEGEHLSATDIGTLKEWIRLGAKMPDEAIPPGPKDHWAYQPPKRSPVSAAGGAGNAIDAFLAAERQKHNVPTNPEADRATLLRRVYLDLIGVPPTPAELHAFLQDTSADAYEKVVDLLLRSPMYGERWGRHWMDVWRYSDPFGLGEEYRYSQRHIWRWRDWIVESLNADKGYDRMILEMLAGDELAPADRDTLRATGYLARNWYKFNRNVWLQDTVEYTAAGFLGITMRCARCHDHKYDPISQQDYYRFRAFFEPHDVRIDPMPGEPDVKKDGLARAFDGKPAEPTYLFARGDERMADKSKALSPGVPGVLGSDPAVTAIAFGPKDFAALLSEAAAAARKVARADRDAAEAGAKRAAEAVAAAKRKLKQVVAGMPPKEAEVKPFLHDTFAKQNDDVWKVVSGKWAWENGRLVCNAPSTFATVTAEHNHPAAMMGRIRFKPTGGGIGSVGFSYDAAGQDFQAVYVNAGSNSAVRPFHRVKGQDSYPQEGVVPYPVKFGDEVTLDFAVRGDRLNVWVNGKLASVYRLPVARKPGTFTIWTHDATAEFLEVRLAELPDSVPLAEKPGEQRPSPVGGPVVLTPADAERVVKQAEATATLANARLAAARAAFEAIEARLRADERKLKGAPEADWKPLAHAAGKAEHKAAALKAAEVLLALEQAANPDKAKVAAARKAKEAADTAAAKDDPTYTPLVKMDPATSTGRRLALAKWIADGKNPLTARVAVNHIWMRHFGTPLVASVANFGLAGKKPTHPDLLDWLAVEFVESGWSMKHLHRLLVTSRAYRLTSRLPDQPVDPENRLYGRMNPRRMEAEVVRDSLLAVAGRLDPTMSGPILDEKLGQTSRRRSVYFRFNTEYKMQFLDQFDAASPTECFERRESVIPQQALALHNSVLALNVSRDLATQVAARTTDPTAFVIAAFEHVLCRPPTADERMRCESFLRDQAALYQKPDKLTPFPAGPAGVTPPSTDPAQRAREDLVQVLVNHNDFVTIR